MNIKQYIGIILLMTTFGGFVSSQAFVFNNIRRLYLKDLVRNKILNEIPLDYYNSHKTTSEAISMFGALPVLTGINAGWEHGFAAISEKIDFICNNEKKESKKKRFKERLIYHGLMESLANVRYFALRAVLEDIEFEEFVENFFQDETGLENFKQKYCKSENPEANKKIDDLIDLLRNRKIDKSFETLGVDKDATEDQITKAYRRKALDLHPDKNASSDATSRFQELRNAFEKIKKLRETGAIEDDQIGLAISSFKEKGVFKFIDSMVHGTFYGKGPLIVLFTYPIKNHFCAKWAKQLADKWDKKLEERKKDVVVGKKGKPLIASSTKRERQQNAPAAASHQRAAQA